jgi:hypothetical protein
MRAHLNLQLYLMSEVILSMSLFCLTIWFVMSRIRWVYMALQW